jgi:hypothetical protein
MYSRESISSPWKKSRNLHLNFFTKSYHLLHFTAVKLINVRTVSALEAYTVRTVRVRLALRSVDGRILHNETNAWRPSEINSSDMKASEF